jgi:hypothetical protein
VRLGIRIFGSWNCREAGPYFFHHRATENTERIAQKENEQNEGRMEICGEIVMSGPRGRGVFEE